MTGLSALPPRRTLRHRLRALRAGARRGVRLEGAPLLGRGVVLDVTPGASVVVGDAAVLMDGCRVHVRGGTVRIGAESVLGERCVLLAHGGIEVGRRCVLGDEAVLIDFAHRHAEVETPIRCQELAVEPVRVGDGARIGRGAVLERGARIRPGAEVAPHSVVAAR